MPAVARLNSTSDTADHCKSTMPVPPDVHLIRGMQDLLDTIRARRDEVGISLETMDHVAGFVSGYSAKLLAPVAIKNLGWMSFGAALGSLGIALVAVLDEEQIKRVSPRWVRRERTIQKTGKHHPQPGNKSCKPSLNLTAPQSNEPAPASRAHLRVVQARHRKQRNER